MSDTSETKLMGFVPKSKYVLYTYYLLLGASGLGLLMKLLFMVGIGLPLGVLVTLAGIAGLVMALLGVFVFKPEFSSLDQAHLVYLAVLFAVFFIVGLIVNGAVYTSLSLIMILSIVLSFVQLLLFFTGYNSWKRGRAITKDNIQAEVRSALQRE